MSVCAFIGKLGFITTLILFLAIICIGNINQAVSTKLIVEIREHQHHLQIKWKRLLGTVTFFFFLHQSKKYAVYYGATACIAFILSHYFLLIA